MIVLDASAAYDLLTEGRCIGALRGAPELVAPDLIVTELLNARWKVARTRDTAPELALMIALLERLRLLSSLSCAADAAALAEQLDHPIYDCIYVATARAIKAKLLTLDLALHRKLRQTKLASILIPVA